MNGTILNITRCCTDDGPGIRSTVFLKGCPLRCIWCHNPESQLSRREIMYDASKCISCGCCVSACSKGLHSVKEKHEFHRKECLGCGACANVCPAKALELYGREVSVEEVFEEVKKDKIYYDASGGGVTVSGGEPLLQPDFTSQLLQKCRNHGIHTAIETCGFAEEKALLAVIDACDLILFDIKETDKERHQKYTGVSLNLILRNLSITNERKIPFVIRAPIIPTLNDRKEHFSALKDIRAAMAYCQDIQIMPYHTMGSYKYDLLNRRYACGKIEEPSSEITALWRNSVACGKGPEQ